MEDIVGRIADAIANYLDAMAAAMRPGERGLSHIMQSIASGRLCYEDALTINDCDPRFLGMVGSIIGKSSTDVLKLARDGKLRIVIENLEEQQ